MSRFPSPLTSITESDAPVAEPPAPPALVGGATRSGRFGVGTHVEDANDATVRGVVTECLHAGWKEVATTDGYVVIRLVSKLMQATLTDDEAARAVRPAT